MNNILYLWISAIMLIGPFASAEETPAFVPHHWHDDFENGTIGGWASYPPFQDIAYDYSILCGYYRDPKDLTGYVASGEFFYPVGLGAPESAGANAYYCLRAYRPNSTTSQRIGFVRRVSFYTAEDSVLHFDYWLKLTASDADLLVELAAGDGKRYRHKITDVARESWGQIKIPINKFKNENQSPHHGLELQAITIIAELEHGDPAIVHHFAIDNVRLKCMRRAEFIFYEPEGFRYKHWNLTFCPKHYYPGDYLNLNLSTPIPVTRVTASLQDFTGRELATNIQLSKRGERWISKEIYRFSKPDSRGPMKLIVTGKTESGELVRSDLRLWYLDCPKSREHPRLFFGQADIQKLRERTEREPYKPIWDRLVNQAKNARANEIPVDGQIEYLHADYLISDVVPYFSVLRSNAGYIFQNAFVYAISGEEAAGAYAKEGLLCMANWRQWVHPWFRTQGRKSYYPVGIAAMELGMTYDLIYPLLSQEERVQARRGIIRNGVANSWQEYFIDNRIPNHTSNWISHCTAGPLVALMAFYDELNADDIEPNGEPYFSGLAEKFLTHIQATLKSDGGYGEGYGYQNFTFSTAWPALAALQNNFGVETLSEYLYFDRAYLYPLYISYSNWNRLLDMGDSGGSRSASSNWIWFAWNHRHPLLKWFCDQMPGNDFSDFLYMDDSIDSEFTKDLPPCRIFPEKGNVVFRSGWSDDDIIFNYRAGPHYNHTHADQGSFRLRAYGEELASEAGPGSYYKDPYYWSYFIQSAGHNTILVDGDTESQESGDFCDEIIAFQNRALLENVFISNPVSIIRSELGKVYRADLEKMTRSVYFVRSKYFVIHDTIQSENNPHCYTWQLHPPRKEGLSIDGKTAIYQGEKAWLHINVLEPKDPIMTIKDMPISFYDYNQFPKKPLEPRAVLQVSNYTPLNDKGFLVVLTPGRLNDAKPKRINNISGQGFQAVEIQLNEFLEKIYFASSGKIQSDVNTDAYSAYTKYSGANLTAMAFDTGTHLSIGAASLLTSNNPITVSCLIEDKGEHWKISSKQKTTIKIRKHRAGSATVSGNGIVIKVKGAYYVIRLEAGDTLLEINYD